jgi:hypothetical protein
MMADIYITAIFPSNEQAESASAKLRALRADQVQITQSHVGQENDTQAITQLSSEAGEEFAAEHMQQMQEHVKLTAIVNELVRPQTMRVIEQCGGRFS